MSDVKIKRIGITGGIGAGKSAVTNYLRDKGYTVIDADEVAREAATPGEPAMLRLHEEIGDDIFLPDGELNRSELAKIMYYDPIVLMTVNEIFHKDIRDRMEKIYQEYEIIDAACGNEKKPIFLSVPLLFESDADWMTDEVWLITAGEQSRINRVIQRDGLSEEDVRARMDNQMPEEEKREKADIIIENNGTINELYSKVEKILSDN